MQVSGEFPAQGNRARVWARWNDDATLSRRIPVEEAPDRYQIHLKVGLAARLTG